MWPIRGDLLYLNILVERGGGEKLVYLQELFLILLHV